MSRVPVNRETVEAMVARDATSENYHLFCQLNSVPSDIAALALDALVNCELSPDELVHLLPLTGEAVTNFKAEWLGNWMWPGVKSDGGVATDGYKYLSDADLLSKLPQARAASAVVDGPLARAAALTSLATGPGLPTASQLSVIFRDSVLDYALDGNNLSWIFPASEEEIWDLADSLDLADQMYTTYGSAMAPFAGVTEDTLLGALFTVGSTRGALAANLGLSHWLLAENRPSHLTHAILRREAAQRTLRGPYTVATLGALVTSLEQTRLWTTGTTLAAARLDFRVAMAHAVAWGHLDDQPGTSSIKDRLDALVSVVDSIHAHRDAVRAFVKRAIEKLRELGVVGNLPPYDPQQPPPQENEE